ncbi:MAG TPA: enolase C-terminal domain-like protein [Acidimicrobiales bacterium]|nr:enolase C-terminal domain-like protein [Acidimicrobiales bacterium]
MFPAVLITGLDALDVRFPTSRHLDGSDAMNPDPDYSAAYAILRTDDSAGREGHGLTFTIGRGNEICVAAINALRPFVVGRDVEELVADLGGFWRRVTGDSQLRWIGPEKGAIHMGAAAVVNALWDLYAKIDGKPVWRLLAEMSPQQLVDLVDFRHISDALTPDDALMILETQAPTRAQRTAELERDGYPAYITSVGWLGYDDDKVARLCQEAVAGGWTNLKMKVGGDPADDQRRAALIRNASGDDVRLMMDANQVWDVDDAIAAVRALAPYDPYWIEEPTSPDDVLGHAAIARAIAPIAVATGEHVHNRIMFKQFMQAGAMAFCQLDACRLGGVNEVVAVLLLAAKFGIPVCPHAGGVGLCEYVQHVSAFDYIAVSGSLDGRMIEFADHLHEHFFDPAVARAGRYVLPTAPGYSVQMRPASLEEFAFPNGAAWSTA